MTRNWSDQDVRAIGRDPISGAWLEQANQNSRCDPGCCCPKCRPRWSEPASLSASARSYLKPEQLLQVQVIESLRPKLVAGAKLVAINGELPGGTNLFRMWQTIRAAAGYEPGTPDLMALYAGRTCFIELKRAASEADLLGHRKARGELSSVQRAWRDWAHDQGYGWTVARSVDEVEATLAKWGMI